MLPKKKRVTKELFQAIMKQGKTFSSSLFVFRYISQTTPQYAFVVPKNVAKKATDRNHLRRQGYNTLKPYNISSKAGIFFYRKGVKPPAFKDIKEEIGIILEKTHII